MTDATAPASETAPAPAAPADHATLQARDAELNALVEREPGVYHHAEGRRRSDLRRAGAPSWR